MGKLDSLVYDGSDRRRIIVKQLPERKSQDGSLDDRKGPERVAGGDRLEATIEVVAGVKNAPEHLTTETGRPFAGHLTIFAGNVLETAVVGGLGIVAGGFSFVEGLDHEAARAAQDVVGHAITMPPSTWMHWPVM